MLDIDGYKMIAKNETGDLGALLVEHRHQLKQAAMKILGNPERAEDVVQDVYLKVIEATGAFEVKQPLAYLFQAVRNLAIDRHRRFAFESGLFGLEEEGEYVSAGFGEPEASAIGRQHLDIVVRALEALPGRTRHAFELHRIGGYTQREIATKLDISPSLVNILIHDAMTQCMAALEGSHEAA